jgi:broad specificity phosphatase PhoE
VTTVYLVRHGVHDQLGGRLCGRTPGVMMGEAGLAQAEAVAHRLADKNVETIYTSPMERTRQTAEPIARICGAPLVDEPALNEIDFGDWNGAAFGDLDGQADWRRWNADRDQARAPHGETMLEVQLRLSRWLEDVAQGGAGAVVAVSHSDVIKSVVALTLGLPIRSHDRFEVSPGSITTLTADAWGLRLHAMNEAPR